MNPAMPPRWAEFVLRLHLAPRYRQTVSGDLLEEYRERIHPERGQRRADLWYIGQVAGFTWRENRAWACLLGGAFVARTALDWLAPTTDFHARSTVSTMMSAAIFVSAGFVAAWRSASLRAGALAGVATALIGAVLLSSCCSRFGMMLPPSPRSKGAVGSPRSSHCRCCWLLLARCSAHSAGCSAARSDDSRTLNRLRSPGAYPRSLNTAVHDGVTSSGAEAPGSQGAPDPHRSPPPSSGPHRMPRIEALYRFR